MGCGFPLSSILLSHSTGSRTEPCYPWFLQDWAVEARRNVQGQGLHHCVLCYQRPMPSGWWIPNAGFILHGMVLWVFQRLPLPNKGLCSLFSQLFSVVGDTLSAQLLMTLSPVQSYDSSPLSEYFCCGCLAPADRALGQDPFKMALAWPG